MPTTDELRERIAYVNEYEYRQPPQSAREHAMALATAKAHWKQIADDAITELEARDREIQTWKDTVRDHTYELSQAKQEAAELREDPYAWWESAKRVNAKLRDEVKEYAFLFELQKGRLDEATAVWREATGRHNVSPDLGMLLEWLLEYRKHAEKLAKALNDIADSHGPEALPAVNELAMTAHVALAAYRESQNADIFFEMSTDRDTKTCSGLCQTLIEFIETDHDYGCECRAIAEHRKVAPEATITQEETHE